MCRFLNCVDRFLLGSFLHTRTVFILVDVFRHIFCFGLIILLEQTLLCIDLFLNFHLKIFEFNLDALIVRTDPILIFFHLLRILFNHFHVFQVPPKYKLLLDVFLVELEEIEILFKLTILVKDSLAKLHFATAHKIDGVFT